MKVAASNGLMAATTVNPARASTTTLATAVIVDCLWTYCHLREFDTILLEAGCRQRAARSLLNHCRNSCVQCLTI